jgi:DNA topoisomerase VI subunit A
VARPIPQLWGLPHPGTPLQRNVGIKLDDKDVSRARELPNYAWFQKRPWQVDIKRMLSSGPKYELDALANKDFLTKTYLPRKFKERDWPDETVRLAPGL